MNNVSNQLFNNLLLFSYYPKFIFLQIFPNERTEKITLFSQLDNGNGKHSCVKR